MPGIIFMGTPDFAASSLESLLNAGYEIPLVVCQPDRRKGRGLRAEFSPVKALALKRNIEVFQPAKLKDPAVIESISSLNPDFLAVTAYGKILPPALLELPKKGCVNIHASLLPKWRGAAPIQFALLNGDPKTGVCSMLMDEGMDTGDILLTAAVDIAADEAAGRLSRRLAVMGGELLVETIKRFDQITPVKQDHSQASYSRLLAKKDALVDWSRSAREIHNQFRAFSPPGVHTKFRGKRLIIKLAKPANDFQSIDKPPGTVIETDKNGLTVVCGQGALSILSCQPENKKALTAKDFINGYQVKAEETLG